MRIEIHAVGRLKAGPERELADRYLDRFAKAGPAVGLEFGRVAEIAEGRGRAAPERRVDEARRLGAGLPRSGAVFLLDEAGRHLTSDEFAERIGALRDSGTRALALVLGGPDGHDPSMEKAAELVLCLGRMTWPHQLARVLVAEQLYRAATILAGHPYHRG